ncbi:TPA: ABC transporter ATP-binding protein [Streptococcus pyogenes]|nr:ABC transporter ATP-binding protein [Streptococcus pyogenes]HEP6462098.1 ABC transporter ATP-binding protein [Streptococcus pyogenes]HEP6594515.1 ABC transporter ATP-binding protein [Streptococcus pyogenes]HEP7103603.1 ABC transporter ATP-binding protein [Streptococcus pyogenes]
MMDLYENELALRVSGLNKKNKTNDFSLKNINIEVPYGSIVGNIGRNGAGKSTTISCILGMFQKDEGKVEIFGTEYCNQIDIKKHIGVVLDDPNYSLLLTPNEINEVMKFNYSNWEEDIFKNYLNRFNLPIDKKTKQFSFGMKKKLSLAIALSHETKLLILDEITSGLDPVSRDEILGILLEFIENPENSVYISSHITTDLEKIADYIVFMDDGRVVLSEEKDELLYNYGILRCTDTELEKVEKTDIISYRKEFGRVDILVKDISKIKNKYKEFVVNKPNFDEMLLILTGKED